MSTAVAMGPLIASTYRRFFMARKAQEQYSLTRNEAERQVNEFLARCEAERRPPPGIPDIELQH